MPYPGFPGPQKPGFPGYAFRLPVVAAPQTATYAMDQRRFVSATVPAPRALLGFGANGGRESG